MHIVEDPAEGALPAGGDGADAADAPARAAAAPAGAGQSGEAFLRLLKRIEAVEQRISSTAEFHTAEMEAQLRLYQSKLELQAKIDAQTKVIEKFERMILEEQLQAMIRVLKRFPPLHSHARSLTHSRPPSPPLSPASSQLPPS
jgi:hypothetical protein